MRISDWSSDVCSSDLHGLLPAVGRAVDEVAHRAGLQVARFGNGGDDLRERRIEVALQVLALRLGQRVFGQETHGDRKSVVEGKSVAVRVALGGGRLIKKKKRKR